LRICVQQPSDVASAVPVSKPEHLPDDQGVVIISPPAQQRAGRVRQSPGSTNNSAL
jgi:hypothetical protein